MFVELLVRENGLILRIWCRVLVMGGAGAVVSGRLLGGGGEGVCGL